MDVERLRAETPGTEHRIHLNNAGAALMSRRTLAAMTDQLRSGGARSAGTRRSTEAADVIEATYAGMAQLLGARREEIALFDNSTHAWNAGFYAVPLGPGDRILTGRAEYGSNVLAYLQAARAHRRRAGRRAQRRARRDRPGRAGASWPTSGRS